MSNDTQFAVHLIYLPEPVGSSVNFERYLVIRYGSGRQESRTLPPNCSRTPVIVEVGESAYLCLGSRFAANRDPVYTVEERIIGGRRTPRYSQWIPRMIISVFDEPSEALVAAHQQDSAQQPTLPDDFADNILPDNGQDPSPYYNGAEV